MVDSDPQECRTLLMDAPVGVFKSTPAGRYINVNRTLALMYGYSSPEEMIENVRDIAAQIYARAEDREKFTARLEERGEIVDDECLLLRRDGSEFWVSRSVKVVRDEQGKPSYYYGFVTDITRRKISEQVLAARQRLLSQYQDTDHIKLVRATVDEAEKLTGSSIGFMHFIDEDENRIELQAFSSAAMKICRAVPGSRHYSLDQAGIWTECVFQKKPVIHNNLQDSQDLLTMPEGHVRVNRQLLVPVVRDGKTRAVIGVGNKQVSYGDSDIRKVQSLSDLAWDMIEHGLARQEMNRLERFKQLLMDMAAGIINVPLEKMDQAINDMLAQVGEFTGVDRTYIFEHCHRKGTTSNTYEWCAPGIEPQLDNLQDLPLKDLPWTMKMMSAGKAINIPDISSLPSGHELRWILESQSIKSILLLPLYHQGENTGFAGFDAVRARHDFGVGETELLKVLTEILMNIMLRKCREQAVVRARQQLEASEERHRRLYETMSQGVIYQDSKGNVTSANPAACRILGLTEEALKGRTCTDFTWQMIYKDGRPVSPEAHPMARALKTGKKVGPAIRGLLFPGREKPVWLSITAIPLFSRGLDVPDRAYATFDDITPQQTAREKAELAHKRLLTVLDSINAVIYVADMQTHEILFLNKTAMEDLGNAVGRKCWKVMQAGQKGPCPFCTNDKLLDQDGNPSGVYRWEFQNSRTRRWYDCHDLAIKWVDGRLVRLESAIDITDRKEAEKELEEQHRLLEGILDNIPDVMSVKRPDMSMVRYNRAGYDFLGVNPEDTLGKKCFEIINRTSPCPECATLEALKHKKSAALEKYLPELGVHLNCRAKPILDDNGRVKYIVELIRDITERKKDEERIRNMNQALEKSNAEKDKLFSIIAHDLKSPMSGILAASRIMAADPGSLTLDELEYVAGEMKKNASGLMELLDDLLQWSRVSRGSMEYTPEVLHLGEIIHSSLKPLESMAGRKNISLKIHISDGQQINADRFMVSAILRNLVSNAVKFTHQKGEIRITARPAKTMTVIQVADTGQGMDKKLLAGLFNIDKGKSRTGTEGEKGTGLGLVICREFVEKHGGEIRVKSMEGKGTAVEFTLPSAGCGDEYQQA